MVQKCADRGRRRGSCTPRGGATSRVAAVVVVLYRAAAEQVSEVTHIDRAGAAEWSTLTASRPFSTIFAEPAANRGPTVRVPMGRRRRS
jgi:hypothetical protein